MKMTCFDDFGYDADADDDADGDDDDDDKMTKKQSGPRLVRDAQNFRTTCETSSLWSSPSSAEISSSLSPLSSSPASSSLSSLS